MQARLYQAVLIPLLAIGVNACGELEGDSWPENGVLHGEGFLEKTLVLDCCFRGFIRSIQQDDFDNDGEAEIGVLAQTGVALLDSETLKLKQRLKYVDDAGEVVWFGLRPALVSDKSSGFLIAKGGTGYGDVGLLKNDGSVLWTLGGSPLMAHADLDDDGETEYYVSRSGRLTQRDANGNIIWEEAIEVSHLEAWKNTEQDGAGIFAAAQNGTIYRIDSDRRITPLMDAGSIGGLSPVSIEEKPYLLISSRNRTIRLLDLDGKIVFEHRFDEIPVYHGPVATAVRFQETGEVHIAVLMQSRSSVGKTLFTLFDLSGNVLYQEVLGGGTGLLAVQGNAHTFGYLLVSDGVHNLWKYVQN